MFRFFTIIVALVLSLNIHTVFAWNCDAGYYDPIRPDEVLRYNGGNNLDYCYNSLDGSNTYHTCSGLPNGSWQGTWTAQQDPFYPKGTVTGTSSCNTTSGKQWGTTDSSFSNTVTGQYCWCKLQTWKPASGSTTTYSSKWYYIASYSDSAACGNHCHYACWDYATNAVGSYTQKAFATASNASNCTACPSSLPANAYWRFNCVWGCNAGYYQSSNTCAACDPKPANSSWDSGCSWYCNTGYSKSSDGTSCNACSKPANSSWSSGCNWTCDSGYYKTSDTTCSPVSPGYYSYGGDNEQHACSAKPEGTEWTTGCNYQCTSGYYGGANVVAPTSSANNTQYVAADGSTGSYYTSNADGDLSAGQWKATWTSGNVTGTAKGETVCTSSYSSSYSLATAPAASSSGYYCWCKMTEWAGINVSSDTYYARYGYAGSCTKYCARYCAQMSASSLFSYSFPNKTCNTCPDSGTANAGAITVTQCYVPPTREFTDAVGTYHYSSNCYYSE